MENPLASLSIDETKEEGEEIFSVFSPDEFFRSSLDFFDQIPDLNDTFYEDLFELLSQGRWSIFYSEEIRTMVQERFDPDYIKVVTQSPQKIRLVNTIRNGFQKASGIKSFSNYI